MDNEEHERAKAHCLEVEIWEALDELGEHNDLRRSTALRRVFHMLILASFYEPDRAVREVVLDEIVKRSGEIKAAERLEELMEMKRAEGEVQSGNTPGRAAAEDAPEPSPGQQKGRKRFALDPKKISPVKVMRRIIRSLRLAKMKIVRRKSS